MDTGSPYIFPVPTARSLRSGLRRFDCVLLDSKTARPADSRVASRDGRCRRLSRCLQFLDERFDWGNRCVRYIKTCFSASEHDFPPIELTTPVVLHLWRHLRHYFTDRRFR